MSYKIVRWDTGALIYEAVASGLADAILEAKGKKIDLRYADFGWLTDWSHGQTEQIFSDYDFSYVKVYKKDRDPTSTETDWGLFSDKFIRNCNLFGATFEYILISCYFTNCNLTYTDFSTCRMWSSFSNKCIIHNTFFGTGIYKPTLFRSDKVVDQVLSLSINVDSSCSVSGCDYSNRQTNLNQFLTNKSATYSFFNKSTIWDSTNRTYKEVDFSNSSFAELTFSEKYNKSIWPESYNATIIFDTCIFDNCIFKDTDFSGKKSITFKKCECINNDFANADLTNVIFENTDLSDSKLNGAILNNCDFSGSCILSGCDFSETNISNKDFSSLNLNNIIVKKATISGCDFSNSEICNVDFTTIKNKDLTDVNFRGATLTGCNFSGMTLNNDFTDAIMYDCNFTNCNLTTSNFTRAKLSTSTFSPTSLSGSYISISGASPVYVETFNHAGSTVMSGATFNNAYIEDTNLRGCYLVGNLNFKDVHLSGSDLKGSYLSNIILSGCDFSETDLSSTKISGTNFKDCNFQFADLSNTVINNCIFDGSNMSRVTLQSANISNQSTFKNVNISASDMTYSNISHSYFNFAKMMWSDMRYGNYNAINFSDADMTRVKTFEATFTYPILERATFSFIEVQKLNLLKTS